MADVTVGTDQARERIDLPRAKLRTRLGPTPAQRPTPADLALKRGIDIVLSAVLLLLCMPVLLLIAVLVVADSPGPPLYSCTRVGQGGRRIRVLKFRKMRDGVTGPALTLERDERLTRIGSWLAATKLDELPQLWNVLRGDMSLVGPRPEDAMFVALRAAEYARILGVKPGMTGLSQLAFTREREILAGEDAVDRYVGRILPQKIGIDLLYARRRTLALDLRILLWTAVAVVLRRDLAVDRASARLRLRRAGRRRIAREGQTDRRSR
jgi:lipopolysaccharide/colanic/teichoic acid biosynthesis glycosyltransferase